MTMVESEGERIQELKNRIRDLERQNRQLKQANIQLKELQVTKPPESSRKGKKDKPFRWENCKFRYVAMKLSYLGWDYSGFAGQIGDQVETVEKYLLNALLKTKLIKDRESALYQRCGRTDKGVSAITQVITLQVREVKQGTDDQPYLRMINANLPAVIRVYAYAFIDDSMDARFSCMYRTYKYFFHRRNLDVSLMKEAVKHFQGDHDFRHFAKLDPALAQDSRQPNMRRRVTHFDLYSPSNSNHPGDICYFTITGQAFLWHQVRNMVAVLFLIGQRLEEPDLIKELLAVSDSEGTPNYNLADSYPLVLSDVGFEGIRWIYPPGDVGFCKRTTYQIQRELEIKRAIVMDAYSIMEANMNGLRTGTSCLDCAAQESLDVDGAASKHVKIMNRTRGPALAEQVAAIHAKQKR
eukprot:Clim_evm18s146 gene=Clim_evmTU18s146